MVGSSAQYVFHPATSLCQVFSKHGNLLQMQRHELKSDSRTNHVMALSAATSRIDRTRAPNNEGVMLTIKTLITGQVHKRDVLLPGAVVLAYWAEAARVLAAPIKPSRSELAKVPPQATQGHNVLQEVQRHPPSPYLVDHDMPSTPHSRTFSAFGLEHQSAQNMNQGSI